MLESWKLKYPIKIKSSFALTDQSTRSVSSLWTWLIWCQIYMAAYRVRQCGSQSSLQDFPLIIFKMEKAAAATLKACRPTAPVRDTIWHKPYTWFPKCNAYQCFLAVPTLLRLTIVQTISFWTSTRQMCLHFSQYSRLLNGQSDNFYCCQSFVFLVELQVKLLPEKFCSALPCNNNERLQTFETCEESPDSSKPFDLQLILVPYGKGNDSEI